MAKSVPVVYSCKNCGRITSEMGHLCSPLPVAGTTYCEYCGAGEGSPWHLCRAKVTALRYVCKNCGRAHPDAEALCAPAAIFTAQAPVPPEAKRAKKARQSAAKKARKKAATPKKAKVSSKKATRKATASSGTKQEKHAKTTGAGPAKKSK